MIVVVHFHSQHVTIINQKTNSHRKTKCSNVGLEGVKMVVVVVAVMAMMAMLVMMMVVVAFCPGSQRCTNQDQLYGG